MVAKKVKLLRLEVCVNKERHPVASNTDSVRQFVDVPVSGIRSLFRYLHHLGTIRQQSEHRKKALFRMANDPERLERFQRKLKIKTEGYVATLLRYLGREVYAIGQTVN